MMSHLGLCHGGGPVATAGLGRRRGSGGAGAHPGLGEFRGETHVLYVRGPYLPGVVHRAARASIAPSRLVNS